MNRLSKGAESVEGKVVGAEIAVVGVVSRVQVRVCADNLEVRRRRVPPPLTKSISLAS
jgi:hypothetical protein